MIKQDRIKELVEYNPETGIFISLIDSGRIRKGKMVGTMRKDTGHLKITLDGFRYPAHRIAYIYVHGDILKDSDKIDHINRIPGDNRITNLRIATQQENMRNSITTNIGKAGFKGISPNGKNSYMAYISNGSKRIYLGTFQKRSDGIIAYNNYCQNNGLENIRESDIMPLEELLELENNFSVENLNELITELLNERT